MHLAKSLSVLVAVILIVAAAISGCGYSPGSTTGTAANASKVAPDFTAVTLTGNKVSFSADLKGKPLVLNFAASWCGPCEQEAPVLAKMQEKYNGRVNFFGFAVKDDPEDQKAFAERHGLKFPIGLDPNGDIVYSYQKAAKVSYFGIPTTFFIDADGNIKDFFIGPMMEKTFDQKVASILPAQAQTTATGTTNTVTTNAGPPVPTEEGIARAQS